MIYTEGKRARLRLGFSNVFRLSSLPFSSTLTKLLDFHWRGNSRTLLQDHRMGGGGCPMLVLLKIQVQKSQPSLPLPGLASGSDQIAHT